MIASLEEIKTLLQIDIDDETKNKQISALMEPVQLAIIEYCNNKFKINNIYLQSTAISFDKENKKITHAVSGYDFTENYFVPNMHVVVEGSASNDNIYKVASVDASNLTLDDEVSIALDEEAGQLITVSKVKFPPNLKIPFAKIIEYEMNKSTRKGKKSESVAGNYSVTFGDHYPKPLIQSLSPYRKLRFNH